MYTPGKMHGHLSHICLHFHELLCQVFSSSSSSSSSSINLLHFFITFLAPLHHRRIFHIKLHLHIECIASCIACITACIISREEETVERTWSHDLQASEFCCHSRFNRSISISFDLRYARSFHFFLLFSLQFLILRFPRRYMETETMIDDQFSKLHPCFPTNTRIGIVGAGPSGLSAAYALCKLGYSNVTVLEKHHSVGGMCESVNIKGRIYDLGGQVLAANSAPTIFHLAKQIGAETEELDTHKFAIINSSTGKYNDMKVVDDYVSVFSLTLKLHDEAKGTGRIGVHAISDIASELTPSFLKEKGLKSVPRSVVYGYTASGFGYVQDMPYAYVHEFTRTSMAGKTRRFKGGYTSVWQKLSNHLPAEVHCNTRVLAVNRNSDSISVDVRVVNGEEKRMEFDKLIISGSFPVNSGKTYRSPTGRA